MLRATPPGEDGVRRPRAGRAPVDIEGDERRLARAEEGFQFEGEDDFADDDNGDEFEEKPTDDEFLQMVYEADQQALQYVNQVNRDSWQRGYRAYHQEHADGSRYRSSDYSNRSRLFIPKTRTSVRKDMAATAASLFGSLDAVNAMPGNEGDPMQRASAAVIKELLNYRTDRSNQKASIPWFHVAMGSRQTSLITGVCLSKQCWKLELKRKKEQEEFEDEESGEKRLRDVWAPWIDRPDCELIAPENFVMDPAADWTNPAQDAAYIIIKWPMRVDEIRRRQRDPRRAVPAVELRQQDFGLVGVDQEGMVRLDERIDHGAALARGREAEHHVGLVERGAGVVLRQHALERRVVALDAGHGVVDELADGRLARLRFQVRPARLGRHKELMLVAILGIDSRCPQSLALLIKTIRQSL